MNFLNKIGHFFGDLFSSIHKAWDNLTTVEQSAAHQASGIIAIINSNLQATPDVIWQLITEAYPGVDKATVTTALANVSNTLANVGATSLETAISALQSYLGKYTGNTWAVLSKSVVALIANELAPGTVIQKIELVIEWVYQNLIKGKIGTPATTAPTAQA